MILRSAPGASLFSLRQGRCLESARAASLSLASFRQAENGGVDRSRWWRNADGSKNSNRPGEALQLRERLRLHSTGRRGRRYLRAVALGPRPRGLSLSLKVTLSPLPIVSTQPVRCSPIAERVLGPSRHAARNALSIYSLIDELRWRLWAAVFRLTVALGLHA
jgi:hypothetical protein